jgi:2-dehydro-3-deoxygluconokinase
LQFLRQYGVTVDHVLRSGERLGIYYLEHGAVQRGSNVIYDRAGSSFATIQPGMVDWGQVFDGASWFHWTGITPAVSQGAAQACQEAVQQARACGLVVSCDLNYRAKLWKWGRPAGEVMRELVSLCDVAVGNEEDAEKVFNIHAPGADVTAGQVEASKYAAVCEQLAAQFPNLQTIAITLRGSRSASHNSWSAVLWREGRLLQGPQFEITHIVDRVGAGDSFVAGLIYGLLQYGHDYQRLLDFAVAASALKHSIFGDFNQVTVAEVEKLAGGDRSGRVSR